MNSQDNLKLQKRNFLEQKARDYSFYGNTRAVFLKRFESDEGLKHTQLAEEMEWPDPPSDKVSVFQYHLKIICKKLKTVGCPIEDLKRGENSKDNSPWQKANRWLWNEEFPKWQAKLQIDQQDICLEELNNQPQLQITRNATVQWTKTVPFQAPLLPAYYVDRPEYSQDLKARLLTESNDMHTLVVTAIHGMGSVGKSTLAMAVAYDEDVRSHFSDGNLWATLGQQPDVLSLLNGWVQALGDKDFKTTSIEAATTHLRTLLHEKEVLLVVDDVWETKHAQAFNVGGFRCQLLVTTREEAIAKVLGVRPYRLDVMKPSQAMKLLANKLEHDIIGVEYQEAETLAKEVGYLPLALELVAAQVASGTSWVALLQDIKQEIAQLKTFDDPEARNIPDEDEASLKRLSLTASLNLSVQRLPKEERQNFTWLGVLPEDATITKRMTVTLWNLDDERDAHSTLQYLQSKALLLPGVRLLDGTPTYRLHDLFHDLARNLLTTPTTPKREGDLLGLGLTLVDAHTKFLERYREKTKNGQWHTLGDDGYIHQRLVWHLSKALKVEEIHSLLQEETESGRNGWYEACDRLGQTGSFVTDVARAWRLAEEIFEENSKRSQAIALQCRYALIVTSLNSLAKNIPASLMAALIKQKLWSPAQGLAYAQQAKEPSQRAEALSTLAPYLSKSLLSMALDTACGIQDDSSRAKALSGLARHLPEPLLQRALNAAYSIQDDYYRVNALDGLAPYLPEPLLQQALNIARGIQDDSSRAVNLCRLAPYLPEPLLEQALDATCGIQDESSRANALDGLAPYLPEPLLEQALDATCGIQDESSRAIALSGLAPRLPKVLEEAFDAACGIQDDFWRANALSKLASCLPEPLLEQALDAARGIQGGLWRANALSKLAPRLPEPLLEQALDAARGIQGGLWRANALSKLAPYLPEPLLEQALDTACGIQDDSSRANALCGIAPYLPEPLLEQALDAARGIQDDSSRADALCGIALRLRLPEVLKEALEEALNTFDIFLKKSKGYRLSKLAPYLTEPLLQQALNAACSIQNNDRRADALSGLALHLPKPLLQQALDAARGIQDDSSCADALDGLAPYLPEPLLQQALDATCGIQDDSSRAAALSKLAPYLPELLLQQALNAACGIQDDYYRVNALCGLAPRLPEVIEEALDTARSIQDDYYRVNALCRLAALSKLAPYLPELLLQQALNAACGIQDESSRAAALSKLAPYLPELLLQQALNAARSIQDDYYRVNALCGLAPHLPKPLLQQALDAARGIQNDYYRANALSRLAPYLTEPLLQQALDAARGIQNNDRRAIALSGIAPHLSKVLTEARDAARGVQDDYWRAKILCTLAPHLPELLTEAFNAICSYSFQSDRPEALSKLAPHLTEPLLQQALDIALDDAQCSSFSFDSYRTDTLSRLAPYLPEPLLQQALNTVGRIQDNYCRANCFSSLLSVLNLASVKFDFWCEILHNLSHRERSALLQDIPKLSDAIIALGSTETLSATVRAIQQVCRQWQ